MWNIFAGKDPPENIWKIDTERKIFQIYYVSYGIYLGIVGQLGICVCACMYNVLYFDRGPQFTNIYIGFFMPSLMFI